MIKIVANMKVQPEKVAEFKATAKEIVEKSRAEAGNISYSLNQSTGDANTLAFIEIWKDQTALDTHNASEHFTRILPQLGAMCTEAPAIELYTEVEY
jgi:quinol monooxygenase YgiN